MLVLHKAHALAEASLQVLSRLFAAGDCLILAFYFLLRPGEYSGAPRTTADDLFRFQDVAIWIGQRRLEPLTCPSDDMLAATFVTVTFISQKNGVRGETLGHGRSGHPSLCPVAALTRRLLHLRLTTLTPINAFRLLSVARWHFVLPADVTTILRRAVALLPPPSPISPQVTSPPAPRGRAALWPCSAAALTPIASALLAGGGRTRCTATSMSKINR
jgi:hypothetical protein